MASKARETETISRNIIRFHDAANDAKQTGTASKKVKKIPYSTQSPKKKPSTLHTSRINFVSDNRKSNMDALKKIGGSFRVQRLASRGNMLKTKVGLKTERKNTMLSIIPDNNESRNNAQAFINY